MKVTIPISKLLPHLREVATGEPTYHRTWTLASRGQLPGVVKVGRSWECDPECVVEIALALGMTLREGVKRPRKARAAA